MDIIKKLWHILPTDRRLNLVILMVLLLIGMFFEILGVGLVIPMFGILLDSDFTNKYDELEPLLRILNNPSHEQLIVICILIMVGVYFIKALVLAYIAWYQAHFVYNLRANISFRLYAGYLNQPYVFHLQRNSAQLIRNTTINSASTASTIQAGILIVNEFLVLIGISILLVVVEPIGALVTMFLFGSSSLLLNRITRNYILRWGKAYHWHEGQRIQQIQQGLGGIKEVKLFGREKNYQAQYRIHNSGSAHTSQRQATIAALPRLSLEVLAISSLAILVIILIKQGKSMEVLLPTLGLFAAAAFRLMPSMNRIVGAIQNIRFSLPAIDTTYNEYCLLDKVKHHHEQGMLLSYKHILEIQDLTFTYPAGNKPALYKVNLSIPRGTSVGFVGDSGAGKTTLIDSILGLLVPDSGQIKVDGIDIQTNIRGWQDQIGYVPQFIFLTDDTLRNNVAFGISDTEVDNDAVLRAIQAANLEQFVNDLPQGLETHVGERGVRLSGGQRQRIGIARALYHNPAVLVLDEATSSLDDDTEYRVMEAVQSFHGDKTIIIIAHRLSTVKHCDLIFRLEQGKIVESGYAAVVLG